MPNPRAIRIVVLGRPVAQGRPRATRHGRGVRMFDPARSHAAKKRIALLLIAEWVDGEAPRGPLELHAQFYFSRTRQDALGDKWFARRPDLDNLIKLVTDAAERAGVIYDDSRVVRYSDNTGKFLTSGEPRTVVELREIH